MSDYKFTYLDLSQIRKMLFHNDDYLGEFADATEQSFREFQQKYEKFLLERNEEKFRKAGHKMKPVAQMLGIEEIVEEYEHAKTLLWDEKPEEELRASANRINDICDQVISDLEHID